MFKSSRSLNINSKSITNNNAVLVAPQINVHGIILSSSTAIPKEVLEFFTAKGAKIEQLTEDGDKLVRLTGAFQILKTDVEAFAKKFPKLNIRVLQTPVPKDTTVQEPAAPKRIPAMNFNMSQAFQCLNSTFVGPSFDLMGIEIFADTPINPNVLAFLNARGVRITVFDDKGTKKIRVGGNFNLKRPDVEQFLEKLKNAKPGEKVDIKVAAEIKEAAEAVNFKKQVQARFRALMQNRLPALVLHRDTELQLRYSVDAVTRERIVTESGEIEEGNNRQPLDSFAPSIELIDESVEINTQNLRSEGSSIGTLKKITLNASQSFNISSEPHAELGTGLLAEMLACEDIKLHCDKTTSVSNAVVLSGGSLGLSSAEDIILHYEHNASWFNPSTIPSLVFAYDALRDSRPRMIAGGANADVRADASVNPNDALFAFLLNTMAGGANGNTLSSSSAAPASSSTLASAQNMAAGNSNDSTLASSVSGSTVAALPSTVAPLAPDAGDEKANTVRVAAKN